MTTQQLTSGIDRQAHAAQVKRVLQYQMLTPDLAYFTLEHTVQFFEEAPENLRENFEPTLLFGIAQMSAISAFIDDDAATIPVDRDLFVVPPAFFKLVARDGLQQAVNALPGVGTVRNDWASISAKKVAAKDVVRLCFNEQMVFDIEGRPVPIAIYIDYLDGQVSDETYDLEAVVRLVSMNEQVIPRCQGLLRTHPLDNDLRIRDLPDEDKAYGFREKTVSFAFSPTPDEMVKIWEKAQALHEAARRNAVCHRQSPAEYLADAVLELDLLGLRAGGAYEP